MAVIHSHPDGLAELSEHDKKTSNFLGVPYIVYSLPEVEKVVYTPEYNRNSFVGRIFFWRK